MMGALRKTRDARHEEALALLEKERAALLDGSVSEVASIVAAREALVSELLQETVPPPESFLDALRTKAERNSRLLLAALSGLRAASERLAEIDRARGSLKTYTARGEAVDVGIREARRDERR